MAPRTILAAVAVAGLTALAHASPAPPAHASPAPSSLAVTGVEPGRVLNLRAEPSAEADKVGELPADAAGVEAMRCLHVARGRSVPEGVPGAQRWCEVRLGAQRGWADARFLEAAPGPALAPLYSAGPAADGGMQRSFLVSREAMSNGRYRATTRHLVRREAGGATLEEATAIVDCARRPADRTTEREARNLWWAVCHGQMMKFGS